MTLAEDLETRPTLHMQRTFDAPEYRVEFILNGIEFFADLPYDPGEGLSIAADGTILGPSRVPFEE